MGFISTGAKSIDSLLGGGVRTGFLTDIFGESGSGKSQLCFTLCANCTSEGEHAIFVDTAGTFRPERVSKIAGIPGILDKITFIRALNTEDQVTIVKKARETDARLLVIDTLTSLFSIEYFGPARHLALMSHLRELAIHAINADCAVVVTNMVRIIPSENGEKAQQREFLGNSVSIYSHVRIKLEIEDPSVSKYRAIQMKPLVKDSAKFSITSRGVSDRN